MKKNEDPDSTGEPAYGLSPFYAGEAGGMYFERQNQAGRLHGELNAWKFADYCSSQRSLLDFGCGGGWLLQSLPAATRVGVDMNPAAREVCKTNGVLAYATLQELPLAERFDVVISHHCLEHVPYPIQALREIHDLLNETGTLILVVPIDDWRVQRDATGADNDHHLHTWTPRLLANTLAEAGFSSHRMDILTHAWPHGWRFLQRCVPRVLFDAICRLWAILTKRRQLRAVACKAKQVPASSG